MSGRSRDTWSLAGWYRPARVCVSKHARFTKSVQGLVGVDRPAEALLRLLDEGDKALLADGRVGVPARLDHVEEVCQVVRRPLRCTVYDLEVRHLANQSERWQGAQLDP